MPIRTAPAIVLGYFSIYYIIWSNHFRTLCWIAFFHSKFYVSEKAIALRQENQALKIHHVSLQQELNTLEGSLSGIKQNEASLQKKLATQNNQDATHLNLDQKKILLADMSLFSNMIEALKQKSVFLHNLSHQHNEKFRSMMVSDKDLTFLMRMPSIAPVELTNLTKLSSGFGVRINPFHKGNYDHPGADFAAVRGTSVFATGNGRIVRVVSNSSLQAGYGNYIEIDHGNTIITRYAHLEEVHVKPGQKVSKGWVIGTVGSSGGSIAPHLHYEIIRSGEAVNPLPYMMEKLSSKVYTELQKSGNRKNQSMD